VAAAASLASIVFMANNYLHGLDYTV
jgi:hypothetical protein